MDRPDRGRTRFSVFHGGAPLNNDGDRKLILEVVWKSHWRKLRRIRNDKRPGFGVHMDGAPTITNSRPLFLLPLQQTMSAPLSAASPAVLSRCRGVQNGHSSPSSTNPNNNGPRPTLVSPQRRGRTSTLRHQPRQLPALHRSSHRTRQTTFVAQRVEPRSHGPHRGPAHLEEVSGTLADFLVPIRTMLPRNAVARQHRSGPANRTGLSTREAGRYFLDSTAARNRSSDSTSAGSATVSAISWRKSSRYLLRSR